MPAHVRPLRLAFVILAVAGPLLPGCTENEPIENRLSEADLAPGPISAYGVTLTADSPPADVAYVLLSTLREDREAVEEKDRERRGELFRRACRLAAADKLVAEFKRMIQGSPMTERIVAWRAVREIVLFWRPVTAHYVSSVPAERPQAAEKMFELIYPDNQRAVVYCDVTGRDGTDATLQLDLTRTDAGWRVGRIGFSPRSAAALREAGEIKAVDTASSAATQPS